MQASDWDASWHLLVEVFLHIQLGGGPKEDQVHTGEMISLPETPTSLFEYLSIPPQVAR